MKAVICVIACFAALLSAFPAYAQQRLRLEGSVTSAGAGVPQATVEIVRDEERLGTGITNADGRVQIDFPWSGSEPSFEVRFQIPLLGTRIVRLDTKQRRAGFTEGDVEIVAQFRPLETAKPGGRGGRGPTDPGAWASTEQNNHAIVKVFYATDRAAVSGTTAQFAGERAQGGRLTLGRYDVSVPRDRRMGTIGRPDIWTFWREDPAKHFIIVNRLALNYQGFQRSPLA